jgi:hypothetical protein
MKASVVITIILMLTMTAFPLADNRVSIQLIKTQDLTVEDTVISGIPYHFQISLENDFILAALSLGFRVYADENTTWTWESRAEGMPDPGLRAVDIVPGCRLGYPDGFAALDGSGLMVTEQNMDEVSSDSILLTGFAMMNGLPVGDLEPMINIHFTPRVTDNTETGTICIDSAFIPPTGVFRFLDFFGGDGVPPDFDGPYCWPVKSCCDVAGDANDDGMTALGDAVYLIAYIFKGGDGPICNDEGDANGDGDVNIGDAVHLIAYVFHHGSDPVCP